MPAGWWRSRQARALARNRDGTRSPAGQPRAGFGASGSRKCASSPAAPAASRLLVSSTMIRAWAQEIVPDSRAARVSGSAVVRARASARRAAAVRSLTVRTQATSATRAISWTARSCGDAAGGARPGCLHVVGGQPHLQRGGPGLQPGDLGQPVQAASARPRSGSPSPSGSAPGGSASARAGAGQGSKRGNGRGDGLHRRPAFRTPTLPCSPHSDHLRSHRHVRGAPTKAMLAVTMRPTEQRSRGARMLTGPVGLA